MQSSLFQIIRSHQKGQRDIYLQKTIGGDFILNI